MNLKAFSLVELSIVLVILGLLTGGILAGQSLIRAAELRSVSTEYARYTTAINSFRDKYFAVPGDMNTATKFWKFQNAAGCTNSTGAATDAAGGVCDGNGNGTMNVATAVSQSGEIYQLWRELALAGLIEGSYSGINGTTDANYSVTLGTNVPASRLSNAGWSTNYLSTAAGMAYFDLVYGNIFYFGAATTGNLTSGSALKPEELWNIDTKMDDGKPGRGNIYARNLSTCTNAATNTSYDADYALTSTALGCAMLVKLQ